ncbi:MULTISPECIES: hypothetical protein [unclassified Methanoregula]|uniref:hypothetical protein n=1 Tax=unclassified Methanoregula TaxID=2649730 RepID=UPI0009CA1215|nr:MULTISPECIES: hypothetical protein [unclassified Methanoregula]OPX63862.1 MAG: YycH protein [Methanoregula sp. PtaB.Bin085]OPY35415.1 MAG: YycH protein [Methanoregula sp. PtaU1.Bin006]
MKGMQKDNRQFLFSVLGIVVLIAAVIVVVFFLLPDTKISNKPGPGDSGCRIDWTGTLVDPCVPVFKIVNGTNNSIGFTNFSAETFDAAPSPEDCKILAVQAMNTYGGMPPDAVFTSIMDSSTWSIGREGDPGFRSAVGTRRLNYRQTRYGMPIHGKTGWLEIELSFGGNVTILRKHWFSIEEQGLERIIPASQAIERLKNGEGKNLPPRVLNLTIHDMKPGYYAPDNVTKSSYLEPVWIINATDEIQNKSLRLYVPAGTDSGRAVVSKSLIPAPVRNFSQVSGKVPQPDVTMVSNVLIGTNGPIGNQAALESIRNFTNNPDINLTYNGRFIEHNECGRVYFWNYYDFTSPDCEFKVETYTGTILFAVMNKSCSNVKIHNLSTLVGSDPEHARNLVTAIVRDRYPEFDEQHMSVSGGGIDKWYGISYGAGGNSSSLFMAFNKEEGQLTLYELWNSNEVTQCGRGPVRISDL